MEFLLPPLYLQVIAREIIATWNFCTILKTRHSEKGPQAMFEKRSE